MKTPLELLAAELVDDEIRYFEEDGMTVKLTPEQIATMKEETLQSLCDAFNEERDAINDYVRAHAHMNDEEVTS